ncbi:MAG: ABC transporter permease [Chloroflexi bacterium]|nr:ABC transporter permease [Chloroflexota bacterium]
MSSAHEGELGSGWVARNWLADFLREILRNRLVVVGLFLVFIFVLLAVFAEQIAPYAADEVNIRSRFASPSAAHPFGADNLGRDTFSRLLFGIRISLWVSIVSVSWGGAMGVVLGLISGYLGGRVDMALSRLLDMLFGIPTLLLAIALSGVLGAGLINPILAIGIVNVPFFARLTRAPTLVERAKPYVEASVALGAHHPRILFREIAPNVIPIALVQSTLSISYAILIEAALGFVGLGVQPPEPSLGRMLSEGREVLELAPWFSFFPGLAIMIMVLAFNLAGDGMRDALDPTIRGRD